MRLLKIHLREGNKALCGVPRLDDFNGPLYIDCKYYGKNGFTKPGTVDIYCVRCMKSPKLPLILLSQSGL